MARKGTLAQRMETARKSGLGITPEANAKAAEGVPFGNPVTQIAGVVGRVGRAMERVLGGGTANAATKPTGNGPMDRHNARANEFALTEAERQKQLARLDRMRRSKP